ncbi:DUF4270 domain-containing protein [Psychroserpens burtonensis]|uniref:DUF4270 domain-containing protein n=1 Tax=Psychroserpens burtonensis TaxID=49278 RepID=A0A5C7B7U3_9FLAO|nr:DUF4270 domain-containing protein [Psychroserpens burtonensis]TXE17807.1 DUF4270 domain-containing protein [Psychroserpens burtonensis]
MKKIKIALRNLTLLTLLLSSFIACDKDFANIDSDIINNDNATHFDTGSRKFDVIAYTKALEPIQTNALPLNLLGVYTEDPGSNYGRSTASFVSQIRGNTTDPDFGTNPIIDSVVLTVPYFSTPTGVDSNGRTEFNLDSIFGNSPINLSIYESNYFLRDFDPNAPELGSPQNYYANKSTGSNLISNEQLEGQLLYQNTNFKADPIQIILTEGEDEIEARLSPAMRIKFDDVIVQQFWQEKIIDMAGQTELSNINNFNDYFRGIYFKAEPNITDDPGQLMLLNMTSNSSSIIIYYTKDAFTEGADRVKTAYTFNFTGNRVNFIANDFTISNGNETTGDENLFLKGGQGSIAEIKLFGGDDLDSDNLTDNTFELFKKEFVETDDNGNFISSKKLINEANLIFYVNQNEVNEGEPNRIYIYDMNNNIALADYFFDTANTIFPEFSRSNHLVPLEREDNEATGDGIRYKIRITEHLNNLILRDSTNVKLGLSVSVNVNLEGASVQYDLLNDNDDDKVPVSSILTPRGTVLYGNNTLEEEKKLYLEVFFTEPNN